MMHRLSRDMILSIACLLLLLSCSQVRTRYVSIEYSPVAGQERGEKKFAKITVKDFTDGREDTAIVGIDYKTGADILSIEPVGIGVSQVIGRILEEKGFDVVRINRKESPAGYGSDYDADYHLTGVIEDLAVKVKKPGLLASFASTGRIHFSLYDREGKVVWAGRMRAESTSSSPFVTEKAIEKSINECVRLLGEALASDDKFTGIVAKR